MLYHDEGIARVDELVQDGEEFLHIVEVQAGGRSSIPHEPPHVHVDREDFSAKFWLSPVNLSRNLGFGPVELRKIRDMVIEHHSEFLEAWHGYFSRRS